MIVREMTPGDYDGVAERPDVAACSRFTDGAPVEDE